MDMDATLGLDGYGDGGYEMTAAKGYTVFDTAIGACGIVWGQRGIVGVQLPESGTAATRAQLVRRFPGARESKPTGDVQRAIKDIKALLAGRTVDLSKIALDMEAVPAFHRRVYEAARRVPRGATLSYGEIAARIGSPKSARAVGQALGRNPFAIVVPCHRVLAAGGKTGGFSANGGVTTKLRMLQIEGVATGAGDAATARPRGSVDGRKPRSSKDRTQRSRARGKRPRAAAAGAPARAATDGTRGLDLAAAVAHLRAADPALARVIDAVGPCRIETQKTRSIFGALAEAIVYQQLTGKAAATIYGRVCALFPDARRGPTPEHILGARAAKLRGAGLSRAKTLALKDLARKTAAGEVPTFAQARRMADDALVDHLTAVRGIGRWTVEMLLIFRLGRPDVLPADDYGVRKGFAVAFKKRALPSRKDLEKRAARWKPYRTVASWYLWRALELKDR
jgi:methylated-DNA-[protein]-cysteine S-methyltransferase